MEITMEQVRKDHYLAFCEHLQVCDPFFGCRFLKGDTSSLWYEFGARNVDRKALDVCLFLRLDQVEVVMAQDVEWVCCFMEGQKIPQAQVF
jgi:hypothetical protein